jgi:hypothetical protein
MKKKLYLILLLTICFFNASAQKSTKKPLTNKTLIFQMQKQPELNLCWAAVTASVSHFYKPTVSYSICQVAGMVVGNNKCCNDIKLCDMQKGLKEALTATNNFVEMKTGMPSLAVIRQEIGNDRVICLRIAWRGTNCGNQLCGHFIVIYGVGSDNKIDVADPWPTFNPGHLSIVDLAAFYRNTGQVTHYYTTKPIFKK